MESEASAIARKVQNYLVIENSFEEETEIQRAEPGIFKNMVLVSLMGLAVSFTQVTLVLLKWVKRLES